MECNKDEASRAKEIARNKMEMGDFEGAMKFVLKSQQLYPHLEDITQMLTVCNVHCSARTKLNGAKDMDFYGILQVERFSDEASIKKQYKKLALSLHPDKNRFPGAEAAFKLIGEANKVLMDPAKRFLYNVKCRASVRPAAPKDTFHQSNQFVNDMKQQNKDSTFPCSQHTSSHACQQPYGVNLSDRCPGSSIRPNESKKLNVGGSSKEDELKTGNDKTGFGCGSDSGMNDDLKLKTGTPVELKTAKVIGMSDDIKLKIGINDDIKLSFPKVETMKPKEYRTSEPAIKKRGRVPELKSSGFSDTRMNDDESKREKTKASDPIPKSDSMKPQEDELKTENACKNGFGGLNTRNASKIGIVLGLRSMSHIRDPEHHDIKMDKSRESAPMARVDTMKHKEFRTSECVRRKRGRVPELNSSGLSDTRTSEPAIKKRGKVPALKSSGFSDARMNDDESKREKTKASAPIPKPDAMEPQEDELMTENASKNGIGGLKTRNASKIGIVLGLRAISSITEPEHHDIKMDKSRESAPMAKVDTMKRKEFRTSECVRRKKGRVPEAKSSGASYTGMNDDESNGTCKSIKIVTGLCASSSIREAEHHDTERYKSKECAPMSTVETMEPEGSSASECPSRKRGRVPEAESRGVSDAERNADKSNGSCNSIKIVLGLHAGKHYDFKREKPKKNYTSADHQIRKPARVMQNLA